MAALVIVVYETDKRQDNVYEAMDMRQHILSPVQEADFSLSPSDHVAQIAAADEHDASTSK